MMSTIFWIMVILCQESRMIRKMKRKLGLDEDYHSFSACISSGGFINFYYSCKIKIINFKKPRIDLGCE